MLSLPHIIKTLNHQVTDLKTKLTHRRLQIADQDNANVSRYITATRWAVEQEIESMDRELIRLEAGIKELSKLKSDQRRYSDKYFVTDNFEYLELGIISAKTPLGQKILNSHSPSSKR